MPKIAVFGASGQLGTAIVNALLSDQTLDTIQIISPGAKSKVRSDTDIPKLSTKVVDLTTISRKELAEVLAGVDVIVSALNGKALEAQGLIQDAAWDARVRRFYPSEYGMHHVYRKPGDTYGYIHPVSPILSDYLLWIVADRGKMWAIKQKCNEQALHHPAISSGDMTYTLIGCGDFYNQPREKIWCPWTQRDVDEYTIHIIGDPTAKVDFSHTDDFASFLLETIRHPEVSENRCLNFTSDHCSHEDIAVLLGKYSGKRVERDIMPLEIMHRVLRDPGNEALTEIKEGPSAFPVDFWFMVKGMQGSGRFWRPRGEVHNGLFPGVKVKSFERYFEELFS